MPAAQSDIKPSAAAVDGVEPVSVTDAARMLGSLVGRARFGGERTPITHHGNIVAGIVSADDLKKLSSL